MKVFLIRRPMESGQPVELDGDDYRYLVQVRRNGPGDLIPARDSAGRSWLLNILSVDRNRGCLLLEPQASEPSAEAPSEGASPSGNPEASLPEHPIHLVQSLAKGRKNDQIIRQAVEAGVSRIDLVRTERSIPDFRGKDTGAKLRRWETIIKEAVQQSGNPVVPEIALHHEIREFLDLPNRTDAKGNAPLHPGASEGGLPLFRHPEPLEFRPLPRLLRPAADNPGLSVSLFVGPEGGVSPAECEVLREAAFHAVFFAGTILRTETAGIYAIGAIRTIIQEGSHWQENR